MLECQEEFCKGLAQVCVTFFAEFVHDSSPKTRTRTRSSRNKEDLGAIQQFVENLVYGSVLELIKAEMQSQFNMEVYKKSVRDDLVVSFKRGRLQEFLADFGSMFSTGFCAFVNCCIEKKFRAYADNDQNIRNIWTAVLDALESPHLTPASAAATNHDEAGADIRRKLQSLAGFVKQELGRESNPGRLLDQLLQQRCRAEIDLPCDFSSLLRKRRPLKLLQHCTDWSSGSDLKWLPGSAESILGPLFVRPSRKYEQPLLIQLLLAVSFAYGSARKSGQQDMENLRALALMQVYSLSPGQQLLGVSFERLRALLQLGHEARDLTVAEIPAVVHLLAQGLECAFAVVDKDRSQYIVVHNESSIESFVESVYALELVTKSGSLSIAALLPTPVTRHENDGELDAIEERERRDKEAASSAWA
eukprot:m.269565 g.269565  ORF g.269565 m.269565 type:complete len:418 (-) comp11081_c0_seq67:338-1591(-)